MKVRTLYAEFLKVLTRDPDCDKQLFVWWWDVYIPKAAGSSKIWPHEKRWFGCISTDCPPGKPDKPFITPSTEAWGLILIENCRDRWPKLKAQKENHAGRLVYTSKIPDKKKAGVTYVDVSKDKAFLGKYTQPSSGQMAFSGWSNAGMERYAELMGLNKSSRALPTTEALEKEILELVRQKHSIEGANWDEYTAKLRNNKPKPTQPTEVKDLIDWGDIGDFAGV